MVLKLNQVNKNYFTRKFNFIFFLEKYDEELDASSNIPKTYKDFLDVSDYVKNRYVEIRNKNKIIDCLLCLTGMITIVLSLQEVNII